MTPTEAATEFERELEAAAHEYAGTHKNTVSYLDTAAGCDFAEGAKWTLKSRVVREMAEALEHFESAHYDNKGEPCTSDQRIAEEALAAYRAAIGEGGEPKCTSKRCRNTPTPWRPLSTTREGPR